MDSVTREIEEIRAEETSINEQIRNCQLVEGGVTPMEYYLWKKKQRINTYDVSIAELCKEIEAEREELERAFDEYREEGEEHAH